jgi:hypothetical protein
MKMNTYTINREIRCANCGRIVSEGEEVFDGFFAVGSGGIVGLTCCREEFEEKETVSDDGLAAGYWKK